LALAIWGGTDADLMVAYTIRLLRPMAPYLAAALLSHLDRRVLAVSGPASRVHVPDTLTVRGCPAAKDGLDGELARLQDQGTGGMAPLAMPCTALGNGPLEPISAGRSVWVLWKDLGT
jgi:hypothetical protein